jgi:hypothetical protein
MPLITPADSGLFNIRSEVSTATTVERTKRKVSEKSHKEGPASKKKKKLSTKSKFELDE